MIKISYISKLFLKLHIKRFGEAHRVISKHFWDVTVCSPLKVNGPFGGTCNLLFQGRRISQARNQHGADRREIFKGLKGVISQKTELFVTTAVRISNNFFNIFSNLFKFRGQKP
jgi:hypothetical protein